VDENACLDFHSPYGCSKGAADQYVRDHARIYNLPTVVFRMSCICGPRQFGTEDQGWVAHFVYSAIAGKPITIYGNGCQVRDILHVDDLLDAMESVRANLPQCRGRVFNLGGGPGRAASVHEILLSVEKLLGKHIRISYAEVRPGDQPLYISNTDGLRRLTGWEPRRTIDQMLRDIREFAGSLAHDAGDHADKRQTLPAEGMVA
jgi:CDP-paratose 2-epimerase